MTRKEELLILIEDRIKNIKWASEPTRYENNPSKAKRIINISKQLEELVNEYESIEGKEL